MTWLTSGSYPQISRHRGDMSGTFRHMPVPSVPSCNIMYHVPIIPNQYKHHIQHYTTMHYHMAYQSVSTTKAICFTSTATSSQCSQFLLRGSVTHMAWSLSARRKGMWKRQLDHNLWQQPAIACFLRHKKPALESHTHLGNSTASGKTVPPAFSHLL